MPQRLTVSMVEDLEKEKRKKERKKERKHLKSFHLQI